MNTQPIAPTWLNEKPKFNWVNVGLMFLSAVKGGFQSLLFTAWLLVGALLAANYYEPFQSIKGFVIGSWGFVFVVIWIYNLILNFKEIKK